MKYTKVFIFLSCLLGNLSSAAEFNGTGLEFQQAPVFLPVDEAFKLSATEKNGEINLYWQISPGYYLYRHNLKVENKDASQFVQNQGLKKTDEYFGDVEVYYEELSIELSASSLNQSKKGILVEFQGCADAGICYPPKKTTIYP